MATSGVKLPTLGESVSETPWSNNVWTTPTNIYLDDDATASVTAASFDTGNRTYVLKATGFNFSSIPDGSTINGVICVVNTWYANGTGSIDLMQLLNTSKAKVGTNQCSAPVALALSTSSTITKGNSSDLWSNALTSTWVKNANFGVALGFIATDQNCDVFVDYVSLEIYYTPPAVAPSVSDTLKIGENLTHLIGALKTSSVADTLVFSETVSIELPTAALKFAWGEESPTGYTAESWQTWDVSVGVAGTVIGDQNWGKLMIKDGAETYGPVKDCGDPTEQVISVDLNDFGTGSFPPLIFIRGQQTTFDQFDVSPTWEVYVKPIMRAWRYRQLKFKYTGVNAYCDEVLTLAESSAQTVG